jgi:hypothetical protein
VDLDRNDSAPIPIPTQPRKQPDGVSGRRWIEVGEPDGAFEKFDRLLGTTASRQGFRCSDQRGRIVGVLYRALHQAVDTRNRTRRSRAGEFRKACVRCGVGAVAFDHVGQ